MSEAGIKPNEEIDSAPSLGVRLLRIVFSIYIVITIIITGTQMLNEYLSERNEIVNDFDAYMNIFGPVLTTALWHFDDAQVEATLQGVTHLQDIYAVKLTGKQQEVLFQSGNALAEDAMSGLIHRTFRIERGEHYLGELTLYSSDLIVLEKVKVNFLLTIANAVIKSIVLWILFLWAFKKFLVGALDRFISRMEKTDFENLNDIAPAQIADFKARELMRLDKVFNTLQRRIASDRASLQTLNKNLEQKVAERTGALKRQQQMLESMSRQGRIGAWELDLIHNKLYWSDVTKEIHEVGPDYEPQLETAINFYKDEKDRDLIRARVERCIQEHKPWSEALLIVTARGREVWVNATGNGEFENGNCVRLFGSFQDIDAQVHANQELESARDKAEAADLSKSQFLASMSHEIRTPMNGLIGMLNIMDSGQLNTEQKEQIQLALKSAKHLLSILNDILDLSKVEAGKLEIESQPFNLHELFDEQYAFWHSTAQAKGLCMKMDIDGVACAHVRGDAMRLKQIFSNLVGNAIKFTLKGEININVATEIINSSRVRVCAAVSDTGIGIPTEKQTHIFDNFAQADLSTTRRFGGTGLGLTISKRLCELMDGDIEVESEEGKGSCFRFTVLLEKDEALDASATRHASGPVSHADINRILLVEDNEVNQLVAGKLLELQGLDCEIAQNGKEALAMLTASYDSNTPYTLILMDCQMPIMDGYQATAAIRQGDAGRDYQTIPIIAMTANAMKGDKEQCLDAGMNDYISKPIDPGQLHQVLSRWLKKPE